MVRLSRRSSAGVPNGGLISWNPNHNPPQIYFSPPTKPPPGSGRIMGDARMDQEDQDRLSGFLEQAAQYVKLRYDGGLRWQSKFTATHEEYFRDFESEIIGCLTRAGVSTDSFRGFWSRRRDLSDRICHHGYEWAKGSFLWEVPHSDPSPVGVAAYEAWRRLESQILSLLDHAKHTPRPDASESKQPDHAARARDCKRAKTEEKHRECVKAFRLRHKGAVSKTRAAELAIEDLRKVGIKVCFGTIRTAAMNAKVWPKKG
jgi:hypothetical protein